MLETLTLEAGIIVGVCALVQSVFGVGVLLFGTPALLLLGYRFSDALWLLLPASLTLSLLQLGLDRRVDRTGVTAVMCYALPGVLGGLSVTLRGGVDVKLDWAIAGMLLVTALLRWRHGVAARVRAVAARHERAMLALIGVVHGLTNLGGGLLTAYAASRHVEKFAVRQTIAVAYALFATAQLGVLAVVTEIPHVRPVVTTAVTAAAVFLLIGRRAFTRMHQPMFEHGLAIFMATMAVMMVCRALGIGIWTPTSR